MIKDRTCDKSFIDTWGVRSKLGLNPQTLEVFKSEPLISNSNMNWVHEKLFHEIQFVTNLSTKKLLKITPDLFINLPLNLDFLEDEILRSKYILEFKPDWDDDNAEAYNLDTLKISINFLIQFATWIKETYNLNMIKPKIYHGPNGSIDFTWYDDGYRLFVNIEKNGVNGHYYSDFNKTQVSEGNFELNGKINFSMLSHPVKI